MFEEYKEHKVPKKILKGLKLNTWYQIIGSYDGTEVKWFVKEKQK